MRAYSLSAYEAGQLARQARQLLRRHLITPHQWALLDAMLWTARKPGSATFIAPMSMLARLVGIARCTVVEGIAALERLGLIQRIRRRVRMAWIGGAQASRQIANAYRLLVPITEAARPPAREEPVLILSVMEAPTGAIRAAQAALEARRRAIEVRMRRC